MSEVVRIIQSMIILNPMRIQAVVQASKRYVRRLKGAQGVNPSEMESLIAALVEQEDKLAFIRLNNLVKLYSIKKIVISIKDDQGCADPIAFLRELCRGTDHLDLVNLNTRSMSIEFLGEIVRLLKVFKSIRHLDLHLGSEIPSHGLFELIAELPVR